MSASELAQTAQGQITTPAKSIAEQLAAMAKQEIAVEASTQANVISTKGGMLTYQGNMCPNNELDVVILTAPISRTYYPGKYDPNVKVAPACWAIGDTAQGMKPAVSAQEPQNATCAGCPKDQWGTALNGGKGKACKETRVLTLLPAEVTKDAALVASTQEAILRPPVTSLKNYSQYITQLGALFKLPPLAVVTKIKCSPHPQNLYEIQFHKMDTIADEAVLGALLARSAAEKQKHLDSSEKTEAVEQLVAPAQSF